MTGTVQAGTGPLHVACASDAGYAPHAATMLHSVLTHHEPGDVVVHFLHLADLEHSVLGPLAGLVRGLGGGWVSHAVTPEQVRALPVRDIYPAVAWLRVLLPSLEPELDKILYLDCDVVIRRPLWPLWGIALGEHSIAAVTNPMHEEMMDWPQRLGLERRADYFNSGVLLMNLRRFREKDISRALVDFARSNSDEVHFPDQDTFNAVCFRDRLPLHLRWNLLSAFGNIGADVLDPQELREARADPAIVHFEGDVTQKPWHYRCEHPHAELYHAHRARTPWPLEALEGRTLANRIKKHLPKPLLATLRLLKRAGSRK